MATFMRTAQGSAGRFRVRLTVLQRPYGKPFPPSYQHGVPLDIHQPVYAEVDGTKTLIEDIPRFQHRRWWEGDLSEVELVHLLPMRGTGDVNLQFHYDVRAQDAVAVATLSRLVGEQDVRQWPPILEEGGE